jgi:predicted ferric reductase
MRYSFRKGYKWLSIYFLWSIVPLTLAYLGSIPLYRTFWNELGSALGLVGLGMFCVQFLFSGRFIAVAPEFGMDNITQFHKEMGMISFFFILAHPVILLLDHPPFIAYLDFRVIPLRTFALLLALSALISIIAISLWREYLQLSYEKWRLLHGILGFLIIGVGLGHTYHVSHYMEPAWKKIFLGLFVGFSVCLLAYTRLVRPKKNQNKAYKVVDVKEERDECYTLTLAATYGKRVAFLPGQFFWITVGDTPFSLQQHPFSVSSSALDENISFTIKALGDFTKSVKDLEKDELAFLEGPFGSFIPKENRNLFLLMGGIGVTPAMSMMRTIRDRGSREEIVLMYGNQNETDVPFKEELEKLCEEINLKVVHIPEKPKDNWEGEKGFLDAEMVERYLPEYPETFDYFICGPEPFMDVAEIALRDLDMDWRTIYAERFKIV